MNLLDEARLIAREAGTLVKLHAGRIAVQEKSSSFDVVTEIDKASEELIRERIRQIAPNHTFLGEEESFAHADSFAERLERAKAEPNLWIVDPIDGTSNFVQGIPGYTISIAMACCGEITLGVIYDPSRDEMYYAEKGKGAYRNDQPIFVAQTARLEQSVIGTGFPSKPEPRAAVLAGLQEVSLRCRTIRALGSAACQMAYVASGKLTAFWENGLNVWDAAAGALIVCEAGGRITDTRGNPFTLSTKDIFCSNGLIHEDLLVCLK